MICYYVGFEYRDHTYFMVSKAESFGDMIIDIYENVLSEYEIINFRIIDYELYLQIIALMNIGGNENEYNQECC